MNWKEIKAKVKSVPIIGNIYDRLYGNKKVKRIQEEKRELLHKNGYDLAEKIENVLFGCNVMYFMDFGNLLGIVRSGHFISHDFDMDYGIYITEQFGWNDLESVLGSIGLKKVSQFTLNGKITEQTYAFNELTVDFFNHFEDEENNIAYIFYKKKSKIYNSIYERSVAVLKMYKFHGTKKIQTEGKTFTIPNEPEKYLASIYTEDWRVPNPNWVSEKGPSWNARDDLIGILETFKS